MLMCMYCIVSVFMYTQADWGVLSSQHSSSSNDDWCRITVNPLTTAVASSDNEHDKLQQQQQSYPVHLDNTASFVL
jgi:hypothetical protein